LISSNFSNIANNHQVDSSDVLFFSMRNFGKVVGAYSVIDVIKPIQQQRQYSHFDVHHSVPKQRDSGDD
jgi:hypothetical protein